MAIGTEQLAELTIAEAVPSQLVVSSVKVVPSDYRILIVYEVIAEPPSLGAAQVKSTLAPFTVVVGSRGSEGIAAARILFAADWIL